MEVAVLRRITEAGRRALRGNKSGSGGALVEQPSEAENQKNAPVMSPAAANVHKALFDVIEFSKRQQWTITNYVVLVYAGIFGLGRSLDAMWPAERIFLTLLSFLAFVSSTWLLLRIQADGGKARERLEAISRHWLTERERAALGIEPYGNPALRGVSFLVALIGVSAIGAMLVVYSLWRPLFAPPH